MFAVKPKAFIGFNLYCGGSPALSPAGPGPLPGPVPGPLPGPVPGPLPGPLPGPAAAAAAAEPPRERRAAAAGPPRALIGCGAAPRALIGCGATLWRPEEELDGCEPEPERGPEPGPASPDGLRQDSLELISRYLREVAGEEQPSAKKLFPGVLGGPGRPGAAGDAVMEKALETLRRVGDGVMRKHELAFRGMLRKLRIRREEDLRAVVEVAAHLFSDGVTNWGRVVTLISFGAFVAKHLKSIRQERGIACLATIITDSLVSSRREWLESQGGWGGFVDFFRLEDLEGGARNLLLALAGLAGLGTGLACLLR
ncbi:induced myeloid leukemia cell differentiation protein Mcl-1 [Lonchura striata]